MTTEPEIDERYARVQVERYDEALERLAARLRDVADRMERAGKPHPREGEEADYNWAASQVLHELMWGVANANVDGFLVVAQDAHNAVRGRVK